MIILFVFNLLLLLLYNINLTKQNRNIKKKKIKKSKNRGKVWRKRIISVSIILSLHLFAVYLHIHTWNDTKRLLSCTFFFLFSFNAKQLLPCLFYFFKILANGIVYFRACRRGIYTDLYLCLCVCIYICVYIKYARNSFTFSLRCGSFTQKKAKRRNDLISTFHCLFVIVPISTIDRASFYRVKNIGSIESCLKSRIR